MPTTTRTFDRNAKGVKELLNMNYSTYDFDGELGEAFGSPERTGVWFVWVIVEVVKPCLL